MISAIDINDWDKGSITKLHDIPVGSYVEEPWSGQVMKYVFNDFGKAWLENTIGDTFFFEMTAEFIPLKEKV